MNTEDEFDNTFRERLNRNNTPMDPENWQLASDSLDLYFKRRKRKIILIWLTGISIAAITIILWGFDHKEQNKTNRSEQVIATRNNVIAAEPTLKQNLNTPKSNSIKLPTSTKAITNKKENNKKTTIDALGEESMELNQPSVKPKLVIKTKDTAIEKKPTQNEDHNIATQPETIVTIPMKPKISTDSLANKTKDVRKLPDSSSTEKNEINLKTYHSKKVSVGIAGAAVVSNSFKRVASEQNKLALNYSLGLYLQYRFSNRIQLEIDAMYLEKSKVNRTKSFSSFQNYQEIQNENLVFGSLTSITAIETKKLQYFMVPLIVNYGISKKQQIELGVSFNYLINTRSTITNTNYKNGQLLTSHSMLENGYVNGFKNINYGILAGYNFNIYPNLSLNAQINLSLDAITKKDYYDSMINDRLVYLRIGIKTQLLNLR